MRQGSIAEHLKITIRGRLQTRTRTFNSLALMRLRMLCSRYGIS